MKMDCTLRCRPLYNEGTAGKDAEKNVQDAAVKKGAHLSGQEHAKAASVSGAVGQGAGDGRR